MNGIQSFFEKASKKRDLSDQSVNGEEPKRQKEGTPESSLNSPTFGDTEELDTAFQESGDNSDDVKTFMKCIKKIEANVSELFTLAKKQVNPKLKVTNVLMNYQKVFSLYLKNSMNMKKKENKRIKLLRICKKRSPL